MKQQLYAEHYSKVDFDIPDIQRREIAYQPWTALGPIWRNQHYNNNEDFKSYISNNDRISAIFVSVSHYLDPQAPMNKRGYLRSDLVFDVDLPLEGSRYDWMYDACAATLDLIKVLIHDLGIDEDKLLIDFSGSKGFHITVDDEKYRNLDSSQRKQMLNYVRGIKVDKEFLISEKGGWATRYDDFKNNIYRVMNNNAKSNEKILLSLEFPKTHAKKIGNLLKDPTIREKLLESRHKLDSVAENAFATLFVRKERKKFDPVDEKVTGDNSRIFRIPNSIHPKTGFASVRVNIEDLENPDLVFDKIKQVGGTDLVTITIDSPKAENSDTMRIWEAGSHTVPRWLALHLLSI